MEKDEVTNYVQVSLALLKRISEQLIFDIYVKRTEGKFSKLLNKGDLLDWERINSYVQKGINVFYVTEADYNVYNAFLDRLSSKILGKGKSASVKDVVLLLKEMTQSTFIDVISKTEVTPLAVERADKIVESFIDNLSENPGSLMKIFRSMSNFDYLYRHAILTSTLSVVLARADGITNETNLHNIGLGGFLHDVGYGQLTFDPESKEELTAEERREMYRHPELGKRMLDGLRGIRTDVLNIVLEHHEQPNGLGYPNGLKGGNIYRPALIVSIADSFTALICDRPYRQALTTTQAINAMKSDVGKFDRKLLELFSRIILEAQEDAA